MPAEARDGRPFPFWILAATLWLAPFAFLRSHDPSNLPKAALLAVGTLVAIVAWGSGAPRRSTVATAVFERPLLLFLLWSCASLLWAQDPAAGARVASQWAIAAAAYLLLGWIGARTQDHRTLAIGLFVAGAGVALVGLAQRFLGLGFIPQAYPPAATFANKNVAAGFVVTVLPLALFVAPGRRRVAPIVGTGVILSYIAVSLTRAAWVALLAQAVVAVAIAWRTRHRGSAIRASLGVLAAAAILGAVLIGPKGLKERLAPFANAPSLSDASAAPSSAASMSLRGRYAMWRNTIAMARDRPLLGVGLGNHRVHYPRYARAAAIDPLFAPDTQLDYVHNDFLQVCAELGLVGASLFLWALIAILLAIRRALVQASPSDWPLMLGATLALVGFAFDGLAAFPLQLAVPPLLLAFLLSVLRNLDPEGRSGSVVAPWPRIIAVVALATLGGCTALYGRWLAADRRCLRMFAAERAADWPTAVAEARTALRWDPTRVEPLHVLGEAALATGRPGDAVEPLERLLDREPYHGNALRNLGMALSSTGDWERGEAVLRRVVALDDFDAEGHFRLARVLERRGKGQEAVVEYRRAVTGDPNNATYRYRLGVAALQARDLAEAETSLQAALRIRPDMADAHKALGVLLVEALGRRGEGIEHLKEALRSAPGDRDAERMRALIAGPR